MTGKTQVLLSKVQCRLIGDRLVNSPELPVIGAEKYFCSVSHCLNGSEASSAWTKAGKTVIIASSGFWCVQVPGPADKTILF